MMSRATLPAHLRAIYRLQARERAGHLGRRAARLALVAGLLLIALGSYRLLALTASWADLSSARLEARLWLLLLASWAGIGVMAALFTLQTALQRQEIGTMLPLPLAHGTRWRLVVARVVASFGAVSLVSWLMVAAVVGRFGLIWTATFLLWIPASIILGVVLTLYVAWLSGNGTPRKRAILVTLAVAGAAVAVAMASLGAASRSLPPVAMIPDAILIPALALGPGARWLGRRYLVLAQERYHAPHVARNFLGPLSGWLGALLSRFRSPWAAMALKELRVQARDVFLLIRFATVLGALPLYAVTHELFLAHGIEPPALIAAYALLLAVYCAIETTPSPFGGEGNRLTLALLTSASPAALIAGKAIAIVAPLLAQTTVIGGILTIRSTTFSLEAAASGLAAMLAVATAGLIMTCLSVRDIDLGTPVEGSAQALLVEHVPNRPMRLVIVGVSLALAAGAALAIVTLPWLVALPLIAGIGSLLGSLAFRDAARQLSRYVPAP